MNFNRLAITILCVTLWGCQSKPELELVGALDKSLEEMEQQQEKALQEVPDAVTQALLPTTDSESSESGLFGETKFDIKADQVEARAFFANLVNGSPYSVAIHPEVQGQITLDLKQVPLSEVFELVSDLYGYDIQRKRNVYRVFPAGMRTETFTVNYLQLQRIGLTQSSVTSGGVTQTGGGANGNNNAGGGFGNNNNNFSGNNLGGNNSLNGGGNQGNLGNNNVNGTNISTITETDFWANLEETLKALIGEEGGRVVVVSPQSGLVTVRAMPDEIRTVKTFLNTTEENVQRQVILEARILEVALEDGYQQGINWTQILTNSGSTDFQFSQTAAALGNDISAQLGGVTSLAFVNQDFSGVINLLSTQGNVQVLSSPRVTATNNQKAIIKVGDDQYFVTDISNQSTITAAATQTTPDIELTPFFSGIALDVTPQIDELGNVMLHVHPSVIETQEQERVITLNQEQFILPLAMSNIRESDTVIQARSGEIVVIGGLMQSIIETTNSKTPFLGSIPGLGELFKSRREVEVKKELIILIKPTVVGADTWKKELKKSREHLADWLYVN
jgi:MSHA biogenesis protein MshL